MRFWNILHMIDREDREPTQEERKVLAKELEKSSTLSAMMKISALHKRGLSGLKVPEAKDNIPGMEQVGTKDEMEVM